MWPETQHVLKRLKKGDTILDIGCGNGRLLTGIKEQVNYIGIDFSKTLLKNAEKLHPGKKFIYGDITKEKTWKNLGKFDAIFCIAALHHIPDRKRQLYVFKKSRKYLKENGFLFLTLWNFWRKDLIPTHFSRESLKLKLYNWRYISEPYDNRWHRFYFTFDKYYLKKMLKESGFNKNDIYYSNRLGGKTSFLKGSNLCVLAKV